MKIVFINRRKGRDRRGDDDPCRDLPLDLFHRKRRKSSERRDRSRTLSDDYHAYMAKFLKRDKAAPKRATVSTKVNEPCQ